MQSFKRLGLALLLVIGLMIPATSMAQRQAGLVNVNVGDVTILENVGIGVGVQAAVQVCAVQVALPVNIIGVLVSQVARTGQAVACEIEQDDQEVPVTITR